MVLQEKLSSTDGCARLHVLLLVTGELVLVLCGLPVIFLVTGELVLVLCNGQLSAVCGDVVVVQEELSSADSEQLHALFLASGELVLVLCIGQLSVMGM